MAFSPDLPMIASLLHIHTRTLFGWPRYTLDFQMILESRSIVRSRKESGFSVMRLKRSALITDSRFWDIIFGRRGFPLALGRCVTSSAPFRESYTFTCF